MILWALIVTDIKTVYQGLENYIKGEFQLH